MNILVTAASEHGSTEEIAQAIADVLAERGHRVSCLSPDQVEWVEDYDAVVLGSAVYAGHWLGSAKGLVGRFGDAFAGRRVWLFSSGPVGDPERKLVQQMGANPVDLAEILERTRARDHRMFAGRLDRRNLSLPQRALASLLRGVDGDFRRWDEIRDWAGEIADELANAGPSSARQL